MTVGIDMVPVRDGTEALVLMEHHLQLAAAYFEATPREYPHSFATANFSAPAMAAWVRAMEALYPED